MSLTDVPLVERFPATFEHRTVRLAMPLVAAAVVVAAYLVGHPYPAYGAGLYLQIARTIAAHGYGLPARIPGYTAGGIPFAYPPLPFYVLAALVEAAHLDPVTVTRVLPGAFVLAYLLPYYAIATDLTGSERRAMLATVLLAASPTVLQWHLSAGGAVRSLAFLFALSSCYAGIRLFQTHSRTWLAVATVTFALVVVSHPTYTLYVVVSDVVLFLGLDRSRRGLAAGVAVEVGGLVLASPWWLDVVSVHGPSIFVTAAGTHGGNKLSPHGLAVELVGPFFGGAVQWPFYALVYLGGLYAVARRRLLLPAWLLVGALLVPENRFLFVPGAMLAATVVFEVVVPAVRGRVAAPRVRRLAPIGVAGLVAVSAVTAGALYGAGAVPGIRGHGPAQPQFVDGADAQAMAWVAANTPSDATFVVLGDTAEWLPYLSDRTLLVGPWGVEWKDTRGYFRQYGRFTSISACHDATCVAGSLDRMDVHPDYVYVPRGRYTVTGQASEQPASMVSSLDASRRFRVVYENDGVVVAKVVDDASG